MSTLYVMAGLSGTGKSTAADIIADKTGAEVYRTDSIRKEIVSGSPTYSRSESQRVYDTLFSRAKADLASGLDVVLDATFSLKMGRDNAEEIADQTDSEIEFVLITCRDSIVRDRLRNRTGSDSDADIEVYEKQKDSFESFTRTYTKIDNSGSIGSLRGKLNSKVL